MGLGILGINKPWINPREFFLNPSAGSDSVIFEVICISIKVHEWVFLKLSSWRGVVRFGEKGKLSFHYTKSYQMFERVSEVAYRLDLLPQL